MEGINNFMVRIKDSNGKIVHENIMPDPAVRILMTGISMFGFILSKNIRDMNVIPDELNIEATNGKDLYLIEIRFIGKSFTISTSLKVIL